MNKSGMKRLARAPYGLIALAAVLAPTFAWAGTDWNVTQSFSPSDRWAPVGGEIVVTNTLNQISGTAGAIGYDEQISGSGTLIRVPPPTCAVPISNSVLQAATNRLTVAATHTGPTTGACVFTHKVSATAVGSFTTSFINLLGTAVPAPTAQTYQFFERPKVSIATPTAFVTGGTATVTVTLSNPNTTNARFNSTNLTVSLGSGLTVANGGGSTTCGGAVTANAGANTVTLGGGAQIPSSGSYNCTVTFPVTASKAGGYPITVAPTGLTGLLFPEPSGPNSVSSFSPSGTATAYATAYDQQGTSYSSNRDRFLGDYETTFFLNFRHLNSSVPIWNGNASILFSPILETANYTSRPFEGPLFSDPVSPNPNGWRSFPGDAFGLNVQCNGGAPYCDLFDGSVGSTGDLTGDFYVSFTDPTAAPYNNTGQGKCSTSGGTLFVANETEVGWGNVNCTFPAGAGNHTYDASGTFLVRRPKGFSDGTGTTQNPPVRQPPTGFTQIMLPSQTFLVLDDGAIPDSSLDVFEQRTGGGARRSLIVDLKVEDTQRANNTFAASANNAYVVALVPGGQAQTVATYTAYAKPPSGAWAALSGPIPAFLQNVAVSSQDQRVRLEIIRDTDVNSLIGTEFYVGYGTSDTEMIQAKRYRGIYYVGF